MAVLNICDCVLRIKNMLGNSFTTAELSAEPRKSQVHPSDSIYLARPARSVSAPGLVIQDLLYISVVQAPELPITITYTVGGTAGSEVVTVVDSDITVQIESAVSTATQVLAAVLNSAPALALVTPLLSGTGGDAQVAVSQTVLSDSYCYLPLAETTTDSQFILFTVNYYDEGKYSGSVILDPVLVPDQSFLDLSSILTVSRG